MNALDEICFLEQQIHDLVRASQDYEGRAVRARADLKKAQTKLETVTKDRLFHENNVRYMKLASTDCVNLNEFAKSKKNSLKARDNCDKAMSEIQNAETIIVRCQEEIDANSRRIAVMKAKLAEYGEVVAFPGKKES